MSSIYRKGRDGYYYYQSYIINPVTGKKDKRIFHALRTKNHSEALVKQKELDLKYNEKKSYKRRFFKKYIYVYLSFIILLLLLYIKFLNTNQKISNKKIVELENIIYTENKIEKMETTQKTKKYDHDSLKIIKPMKIAKNQEKQIQIKEKITIPKYNIERIEIVSESFNQGKIYLTVDGNNGEKNLLLLCQNIAKIHTEFSNIVICLYSNNKYGKDLAKGKDTGLSSDIKKQNWLAMYSFNSVEGEYFDSNPGGYLGAY